MLIASAQPITVYRFRSIESLLDEYHEFENQTIYFASPDELNDPMEGFRDIVWRGDKIVWTNLFKNYLYCLYLSSPRFLADRDALELDPSKIPIQGRWDQPLTPQTQGFPDLWCRFLNLQYIPEIIEALSHTNREIRSVELGVYLQIMHDAYILLTLESGDTHTLITESKIAPPADDKRARFESRLGGILRLITLFEQADNDEDVNAVLQEYEDTADFRRSFERSSNPISSGEPRVNRHPMFLGFHKAYLKALERLLWPKWYTACFTKSCHNSSVWGHYADKHRGACLIFETEKTGRLNSFGLHQMTGKDIKTLIPVTTQPFCDVSYEDKPGEVDFFRSFGLLTEEEQKKLWYTDDDGNESECGSHLRHHNDTFNSREDYWARFYRDVTTKTKDWEYELEYRLILYDMLGEYEKENSRALSYDFNSLNGIIFGINTSNKHKSEIIGIIERKCSEHKRTDFKYFQAYYSPENGDIRKRQILP